MLQNFLLSHFTNLGKAEICIKCSRMGAFANHVYEKQSQELSLFSFIPSFMIFLDTTC